MTAQIIDVVDTSAEAAALDVPPLLVLDAVADYLDDHGIGTGSVHWERIGEGQSNVTYRIRRENADVVLRRGPRPPIPRSTHDMVREARIQTVLRRQGVAVPQIVSVCEDDSVLGVPFYIMDFVPGTVVTDRLPVVLDDHRARRGFGEALVDQLSALHDVDVTDPEVASLGRPEGYLERQIALFSSLWEKNTKRSLSGVGRLGEWLESNRPSTQLHSVVHGDYRAGNAMIAPQTPVRVAAVLDWEMSTLGDPLADLGISSRRTPTPRILVRSWTSPRSPRRLGFRTEPNSPPAIGTGRASTWPPCPGTRHWHCGRPRSSPKPSTPGGCPVRSPRQGSSPARSSRGCPTSSMPPGMQRPR